MELQNFSEKIERPNFWDEIQAWIAQLVAHRLGTMEVVGSNPGKGEDFSKKNLMYK